MAAQAEHPAQMLPLWEILGNTIITTQGVYLRVVRIGGIDSKHMAKGDLALIATHLYEELATRLPEQLYLQFIMDSHTGYRDVFERYENIPEPKNPILALQRRRRLEFIKASKLRRHSLHLVFGYLRGFKRSEFQKITKKTHVTRLEDLDELERKVDSMLARANMRMFKMGKDAIIDLFWGLFNPDIERKPYLKGEEEIEKSTLKNKVHIKVLTPREYLFTTDGWGWHPDYLRVGNRYYKVLTLADLGAHTVFNNVDAFYDLGIDFRLSTYLTVPSQSAEKASLTQQRKFMKSLSGREKNIRDYEMEKKFDEGEELAETLVETNQRLVKLASHVILWADTRKELEKKTRLLKDQARNAGMSFFAETNAHDRYFFWAQPGMATNSKRHLLLTSNNAVDLLPICQENHGDADPVMLVKTARDELFSFNPFEPSRLNWNAVILGTSGSGKSVAMNMLITNAVLQSKFAGRVVIVDFAGEEKSTYLMIAKLFGGEFIPFLTAGDYAINPFPDPKDALDEKGKVAGPTEAFLTSLTDILLSNVGDTRENQLFRNIVRKGIRDTYAKFEKEAPTYSDLLETIRGFVGDSDIDQKRLLEVIDLLQGFVDSPSSKLFNQRSSVKVGSDFIVLDLFGLDSLENHIAEAVVYLTCQWVKSIAFGSASKGYTYVVMDEVAQLIRRKAMVELVKELLATSRKHGASVWLVNQKFEALLESPIANDLANLTSTQIFLNHAKDVAGRELISKHFGFTDREIILFENLQTVKGPGGYSEALIFTKVRDPETQAEIVLTSEIKLELSPFDYETCTSNQDDRDIQREFFERHKNKPIHEILHYIAYEWKKKRRGVA